MRHRLLPAPQRLEPSRAFRLTQGTAWSTDTPSYTRVSGARRGSCPRAPATRTAVQEDTLMRCPLCGFENPEGMKFCGECAAPLRSRCPACGFDNPPRFKFCGDCATPLQSPSPAATSATVAPPQAPLSYTPPYLAEKILTSKSALEGERKQVTVLFADLKGSMELLADRDPEEARHLLDPVLERMMAAVHRYEGTVNQVMGDGIMALFGAPLAHEDHAVRACYAALAIQEAVTHYAEELRRCPGLTVQIRVGLNSGEVVVRTIGSDLHMDYTAVGQTTHLAARMEQLAKPGSVLITAITRIFADDAIQVNPLGPLPIKGLAEQMEVFELVGVGPARSRWQSFATRSLTRFVGRHAEFEVLRRALDRAGTGHGQVVAVIGEPGVGKTRLCYELIQSPRARGWLVVESHAVSYGQATPYLPILDLLRGYFQIEDRDEEPKIREKIIGKLVTLETALGPLLPVFLALLDVPVEDPQWQALDPRQRRQRTLDAVKRLMLRESQVQPVLLVVENLHWIDAETQAILDSLIDSLPTARVLLLVNYRPEYQHGWGSRTYYTQLSLEPLPHESARELLDALLGEDPWLQPLKQRLIDRTQGNAFFLEESIRTLVETQVLVGERGSYRLAKSLPSIQVPATVQAVLSARIDRLSPEEKRLLQTAAVIGTDVPFPLLQAIAHLPDDALRRGLMRLQAGEFLYEMSLFPELAYTFKHALTHEVAYGSLLREQRRALHARIVETIEGEAGDHLADQVERLALHAFRGEVWEKAAAYLRQAGDKAMARSAYREAVAYCEQALEALQHLPESDATQKEAIDLRLNLRNVLLPLGEQGRILDHLHAATTLAELLQDQHRLGWIAIYMTSCFYNMGQPDHAIDTGQRALAMAKSLGDVALEVQAVYYLGLAYHLLGDFRQAVEALGRNVTFLEGQLVRERFGLPYLPSVFSRTWLAWCLAELGSFAEAIAHGVKAVRIAEAVDQPWDLIAAYRGMSLPYLSKGEIQTVIPLLEQCLGLCQIWEISGWFAVIAAQLGYAYALSGQMSKALPLLEQAVGQSPSRSVYHARLLGYLGEAYLLDGHPDDALPVAVSALELSRSRQERGFQAYALRLLGDIAARREPPEIAQGEVYYRHALPLAAALGMRPLLAHCHHGLGMLYAKSGLSDPAHTELSAAIDLYRAMDMTFWLPQAEAALAQVEG
jgi:class 3 adenylate cyclase/tetratricopeptide (TPR) repeat protein